MTGNSLPIMIRVVVAWVFFSLYDALGFAVEGQMGTVTGSPGRIPGRIMDGAKVLAEVPQGTLLWIFSEQPGMFEVKVPTQEQHGWMADKSVEKVILTDQQKNQIKEAYEHFAEYQKLKQERKFADALRSLESGYRIERAVLGADHPDVSATFNNLAILARELGDYPAARKYYDEALAINRKTLGNEHPSTADLLNSLGILARTQGDHPTARKSYEEALAIRRKVLGNEHPSTAQTLNNLGNLFLTLGDFPSAQKFYDEALAIKRKVHGNDHASTADTLNNLGNLARAQGDYSAARKSYEEALAIKRKVSGSEQSSIADTLNNLGILANDQGDFPAARKFFDEALAIKRSVLGNEHPSTADTLNNLGILARDQGDYPTARKYYEEALAIKRQGKGTDTNTSGTLNNLGVLSAISGDYSAARKFYEEALATNRKVHGDEHVDTASTLNNLGILAGDQEDYPAARKFLDEALAIRRKVLGNDHPGTADTLSRLGDLQSTLGDNRAAWDYYDESLRIVRRTFGKDHPNTTSTLAAQARLAVLDGDDDVAQRNFDDVRRIQRRYVRYLLPALAASEQLRYLDNNYRPAWHQSLSYGLRQPDNLTIASLCIAWVVNGKAVGDEAIAARELLARDTANPQLAPLVKELQALRQRLGSLSLAAVKPEQATAHQAALNELAAREFRLSQQLAAATGQTFVEAEWIESSKFRRTLPANTVYIDLVRMSISTFEPKAKADHQPHYVAWIIPPQGEGTVQIRDLGEADAIDAAIEKLRASLANAAAMDSVLRNEGEAVATAKITQELQTVAELVLKPLQPHIVDKKELILSPDGALWLLPWAALPVAENKCLLEQCSIRYVLSGRDLVKKTIHSKLDTSAPAIVVNPDYDLAAPAAKAALQKILPSISVDKSSRRSETSRSSLPQVTALPFTAFEGQAAKPSLERLAKQSPVFYEQEQALEAVVKKLQRPKHLLFSTHGFFLPDQEVQPIQDKQLVASGQTRTLPALTTDGQPFENPLLRCGLLFAGCNAERLPGLDDGILTGMEIVGMDLRGTELVVLSACETGIGKVRNGEGVAGLRQAFQLAGAQSVVSTLWQVPDRDSTIIMQDFFTNLAAGQTKADALRNAQLKRIAARKEKSGAAHPFFWAAWTVTGE